MFTGIVEEIGSVISAPGDNLVIAGETVVAGMKRGGSIAVNGICLTVTDFNGRSFSCDVMPETLRRTNLGMLHPGDPVNLERPLALGGEVGGHLVQGHIDATGRLAAIIREEAALLLKIAAEPEILRFTTPQGFITVDGVSLTIARPDDGAFWVSVVGYTRQHTTFDSRKIGDRLNLEADIIAKYLAQFSQPPRAGVTVEMLREHGFSTS